MSKAYKDLSPCKGCEKRSAECHAKCEAYKAWKKSGIEIVTNPLPWDEMKRRSKRR